MQEVFVPWGVWYCDTPFKFEFPEEWEISVHHMQGGEDIGDEGIRKAIRASIAAPALREFAKGKSSAAILIDDLSRPTPSFRLLPYVIEELAAAGIARDDVKIICALAAHRPLTREDLIKKVGLDIVENMQVLNHNAYENLEFIGYSSRGVPIWVNRDLTSCEVRIAMGMITPRGGMFGGGAKLLIPGACGQQTIMLNHRHIHEGFRDHLSEVAKMAGVDYIVNPLLNERLDIMALVAGDTDAAFDYGCDLARNLYATEAPDAFDIGIFNAFPKDTELCQAGLAMTALGGTKKTPFNENSTTVLCSASPEGLGWHSVLGPGTALRGKANPPARRTLLFSPGVNKWDAISLFGEGVIFCKTWAEVLLELQKHHGAGAKVSVFPAGALQRPADADY